jgi:hypothetical protein
VTLPPPCVPPILNTSMIHPCCPTYVAAASLTHSAAATLRDWNKYQAHAGHPRTSHTFVPSSVETLGHLGGHIMRYLRTLSKFMSARSLAVIRSSFLASGHLQLSVALVQSQGYVFCSCVLLLQRLLGSRGCLGRTLRSLISVHSSACCFSVGYYFFSSVCFFSVTGA